MRRRTPLLRDLQWRGYVNQILPREPISDEAQLQAFIHAAWPRDPLAERRARWWRVAKRTALFDAYLTIIALPRMGAATLP